MLIGDFLNSLPSPLTIGRNPLDQDILTDYLIQQLSTLITDFMAAANR